MLGDAVRSLKMDSIRQNIVQTLDSDFDVFAISSSAWQLLKDNERARILEKVKAGTGLVMPLRGAPPPDVKEFYPYDFLGYDWAVGKYTLTADGPPILNALPYEAMPTHYYSNGNKFRMGADGKPLGHTLLRTNFNGADRGAILSTNEVGPSRFVFAETEGYLVPSYAKFQPYHVPGGVQLPLYDYWEYHYAMMARLIYWAAHKESPVTLLKIEGNAGEVKVSLSSQKAESARIELTVRDKFGEILESRHQEVSLKAGEQDLTVAVDPAHANGAYLADIIIKNDKATLAFGAGTFAPAPKARVALSFLMMISAR